VGSDRLATVAEVIEQTYEIRDFATLRAHPDNPNQGDKEIIRTSIRANGFYGAVIVQKSTGLVLAGKHRTEVALEEGISDGPVLVVDVDDARARRIMAVDNEANRRGDNDEEILLRLLRQMQDDDEGLLGSGFGDEDIADLVASLEAAPPALPEGATFGAPTPSIREKFEIDGQRIDVTRRLMVLDLPVDRFAWLVDILQQVCEREGVETNVSAVLLLASRYSGEEIPRAAEGLDDD
jgi:hypothetical protein